MKNSFVIRNCGTSTLTLLQNLIKKELLHLNVDIYTSRHLQLRERVNSLL